MSDPKLSREHASGLPKFCGRFKPRELLHQTEFTKLWAVEDDQGRKYAAKVINFDNIISRSWIENELSVFGALINENLRADQIVNAPTPQGFPNIHFFGKHFDGYVVIVIDLLSPDLFSLRYEARWMQMRSSGYLMLASEMLFSVMTLHQYGFVHRDVTPVNFRIASGFLPYLFNFWVAKRYVDPITNCHVPPGKEGFLVGTMKYASVNAHRFMIQSRKDDLISLGYSIIDIMKRGLPWDTGLPEAVSDREISTYVMNQKEIISLRTLCQGLPGGILRYMENVNAMDYYTTPNYPLLQAWLENND